MSYTHLGYINDVSLFGQIQLPIFDRNQGEIARAGFAVTQAQEQERFTSGQVLTDVRDAFGGCLHRQRPNRYPLSLGYLDQAQQSLDITEYAYKRGQRACLIFSMLSAAIGPQLGYRQALAAYLLALEQLREAVGTRSLP